MEVLVGAEAVKTAYARVFTNYRQDDEIEVATANHRRHGAILERLCRSYTRPIAVLDVGCGTGRYFHCLRNVNSLVGLDLSPEMLRAAGQPVRGNEIRIPHRELICENIHQAAFPKGSFELIYSLGMFGYGCAVTTALCNRFWDWLVPGGTLYFNTVDFKTFPLLDRWRKQLRRKLYPFLPAGLRQRLDNRPGKVPFLGLTMRGLRAVLKASRFKSFTLARTPCHSPLWQGIHLECLAVKSQL